MIVESNAAKKRIIVLYVWIFFTFISQAFAMDNPETSSKYIMNQGDDEESRPIKENFVLDLSSELFLNDMQSLPENTQHFSIEIKLPYSSNQYYSIKIPKKFSLIKHESSRDRLKFQSTENQTTETQNFIFIRTIVDNCPKKYRTSIFNNITKKMLPTRIICKDYFEKNTENVIGLEALFYNPIKERIIYSDLLCLPQKQTERFYAIKYMVTLPHEKNASVLNLVLDFSLDKIYAFFEKIMLNSELKA